MGTTQNIETNNPFRGIKTYTKDDSAVFAGRDKEISVLTEAILYNHSTIIAGLSGCGKSSLINAGLLPKLAKLNYHTITIKPREIPREDNDNYVTDFYNHLNSQIDTLITNEKLEAENRLSTDKSHKTSLWEKICVNKYFKAEQEHFIVIIIDQFEEIFQLDLNIKKLKKFFRIYEILCNYTTPYFAYFAEKEIQDFFPTSNDDYNKYIRNNNRNKTHFVISIRKDYLFDLQSYSKFFPILGLGVNYLHHLDDDQSATVIRSSAKFSHLSDDQVNQIVKEIIGKDDIDATDEEPDRYVDTMMLSVTLYELWEQGNIDFKNFKYRFKDILNNFYSKAIDNFENNLVGVIQQCKDKEVSDILINNIKNIIIEIEKNLISKSGIYRKTIYEEEVYKLFDYYVYGNNVLNTGKKVRKNSRYLNRLLKKRNNNKDIREKNISNHVDEMLQKVANEKTYYKLNSMIHRILTEIKTNKNKIKKDNISDTVYSHFNDIMYSSRNESITIRERIKKIVQTCELFTCFGTDKEENHEKKGLIELKHDRLCELASNHIEAYRIYQENIKRFSADMYFTPKGRLKHDNCFVESVFGPWNSYSSVLRTVFFMGGGISDVIDFDISFIDKFRINNKENADTIDITLNIKKGGNPIFTTELFSQVQVRIDDNKIYEISFWHLGCPRLLPTGYHKIKFYYDNNYRIVLKDFFDINDKRTKLTENYSSIFYKYKGNSKLPEETYFCDLCGLPNSQEPNYHIIDSGRKIYNYATIDYSQYKKRHKKDKNYGYKSEYDSYGREQKRIYIGGTDYGFDVIEFKKDYCDTCYNKKIQKKCLDCGKKNVHNNLIKSISYFKIDETNKAVPVSYLARDIGHGVILNDNDRDTKIHKVVFKYDSLDRVVETTYYDVEGELINNALTGIFGEKYDYNYKFNDEFFIRSTYKGEENKTNGVNASYALMHKIDKNSVDSIEWRDAKMKLVDARTINGKNYSKIVLLDEGNNFKTSYYNSNNQVVDDSKPLGRDILPTMGDYLNKRFKILLSYYGKQAQTYKDRTQIYYKLALLFTMLPSIILLLYFNPSFLERYVGTYTILLITCTSLSLLLYWMNSYAKNKWHKNREITEKLKIELYRYKWGLEPYHGVSIDGKNTINNQQDFTDNNIENKSNSKKTINKQLDLSTSDDMTDSINNIKVSDRDRVFVESIENIINEDVSSFISMKQEHEMTTKTQFNTQSNTQ